MHPDGLIVHICRAEDWRRAVEEGDYQAASLAREGFIHLSHPGQVLRVANAFYRQERDLVLLWVDTKKLAAELRWESPAPDDALAKELFPHLYGALNLDAVVRVTPFTAVDGEFRDLI